MILKKSETSQGPGIVCTARTRDLERGCKHPTSLKMDLWGKSHFGNDFGDNLKREGNGGSLGREEVGPRVSYCNMNG